MHRRMLVWWCAREESCRGRAAQCRLPTLLPLIVSRRLTLVGVVVVVVVMVVVVVGLFQCFW
ncbi:hypothetical protein E2C01_015243 [Portunus trituberculatus]|uniref:Uncharacterized protein n=1 Tax=Portunus trituberculatus TaxID=210409 RepID=A0A5B7DMF2_PORTR|nr:hypothetical protein [Portunus trituberculatus]